MTEPTTKDVQEMAREVFGRDLSAEDAAAYGPRLPRVAWTKRLIRDWAGRLGGVEPATVYRVPASDKAADDRD